ncbi:MAG: T9SS type A sorting domain-containing protein [Flavobacteriales bacterium]|nr:T9SS type A sorting domain-containing protein [Flavobacteriales bacterium]
MERKLLALSACVFLIAGTATAQSPGVAPLPDMPEARVDSEPVTPSADYRAGNIIWSEDFGGGVPAGWTLHDTSGLCPWKWSLNGSAGFFAGAGDPIASTTGTNGFLISDPDSANNTNFGQPSGTTYQYLDSWFTTSAIDLTGHPAVKLEFEQYFRYNNSPDFIVQVSNDGTTWTNWTVQGSTVANTASANPVTVELNISSVAGDEPTVYLRFGWNARVYFWMIDDIRIVPLPLNDLSLVEAYMSRTDVIYDDFTQRSLEYSLLPLEQATDVILGASVRNSGSNIMYNVIIDAEISQDGVSQGTFSSTPLAQLGIDVLDSVYFSTGWAPTTPGRITIDYFVRSDSADIDSTDNFGMRNFRVTSAGEADGWNVMGHDLVASSGTFYNISTSLDLKSIGNKYEIENTGSICYGVSVGLLDGTDVGAAITVELFREDDLGLELVATSDLYEVQASDLNATGDSTMIFIPFDPILSDPNPVPVDMDPNYDYIAFVTNTGTETVRVVTSGPIRRGGLWGIQSADDGLIQYIGNGNRATHVRPYLDQAASVQIVSNAGLTLLANYPNPVNTLTTIPFTLEESDRLDLMVMDASGRIVFQQHLGSRNAGTHTINFDASALASGMYTYTLSGEKSRLSRTMSVVR